MNVLRIVPQIHICRDTSAGCGGIHCCAVRSDDEPDLPGGVGRDGGIGVLHRSEDLLALLEHARDEV